MAFFGKGHYVWRITDLCSCPATDYIQSPFYRTGNVKWKVKIFPSSSPTEATQVFKVKWKALNPEPVSGQTRNIHYKVSMYLDSKNSDEKLIFLASEQTYISLLRFQRQFTLLKTDLHDNYLVDGVLACRFEVAFTKDGNLPLASHSDMPSALESLRADLTTHLLKQATDVTLVSSDGLQDFPAHRLLLSARSEVFAKMLSADMRETRTGVIRLPDITSPELEQLVNFLYGRQVKPTVQPQLYKAAHAFALPALQLRCSQGLVQGLSAEGVCQVAALAHLHSDTGLFLAAKTFFLDNASAVVESEGYVQLLKQSPDVALALAGRLTQQGGKVKKRNAAAHVWEDSSTKKKKP